MCQRYIQTSDLALLQECLAFSGESESMPRHNIRPAQQVPVVCQLDGENRLTSMRWGMADALITDLDARLLMRTGQGLQQRCLIPADGFYECERRANRRLQPWLVRLIEDGPFCFAGLWEADKGEGPQREIDQSYSCALLTVPDNGTITPIASQVPVILAQQDYAAWLDPATSLADINSLLKPYRESGIYWHPVDAAILATDTDTAALAEPAQLVAA